MIVFVDVVVVVLMLAVGEGMLELAADVAHWRMNTDFTAVCSR